MKYLILIILLAGAILAFFTLLKAKLTPDAGDSEEDSEVRGTDYEALRSVLSAQERNLVTALAASLPPGVGILAKVRLADIFTLSRDIAAPRRQSAFNRIDRRHVDFLLIRAGDFSPLAGITLDTPSRNAQAARKRDRFMDSLFSSSGLPLLRIRAQEHYDTAELSRQLAAILNGRVG